MPRAMCSAWLILRLPCRSMPSATPGCKQQLVFTLLSLLPASKAKDSAFPNDTISGLTTGFSVSRFTSRLLFNSASTLSTLGVEFPSLTLSVVRRVPSYSLASKALLRRKYRVADYSLLWRAFHPLGGGPFPGLRLCCTALSALEQRSCAALSALEGRKKLRGGVAFGGAGA